MKCYRFRKGRPRGTRQKKLQDQHSIQLTKEFCRVRTSNV
jgi:hypothetical protein